MIRALSPLVYSALASSLVIYIPIPVIRLILFFIAILSLLFFLLKGILKENQLSFIKPRRNAEGNNEFTLRSSAVKKQKLNISRFFQSVNPLWFSIIPAVAFGIICGLWSVLRLPSFAPGVPTETITALKGNLLDDPRSLSSYTISAPHSETERGMALMRITECDALVNGNHVRVNARGSVLVFFPEGTMPRLKDFGRGSQLYVEGEFIPDENAKGAAQNARFRARSAHITKASPLIEQARSTLRSYLLGKLKPHSWGGLAAALVLGTRETLDDQVAVSFRNAGLSHVLALSGMHLSFASGLLAFLLQRPLGKKKAIYAGLVFVLLYVFLIGPQPSLIRAAIMYALGSFFILAGIGFNALALLAAAFLLQSIWHPQSAYSISFILSFLALGGILLLSAKIKSLIKTMPPALASGLSASSAAFLATVPVVAAVFGTLRPAGIIASLFAAPLSGAFMATAILYLALPVPFAQTIISYALSGLHLALSKTASLFSLLPGIRLDSILIPWISIIIIPLIIAFIILFSLRRERYRSYLAPFEI